MEFITVDLGSFNIKNDKGLIFENRFILDNESETFGAEVLSYNENNYFFGKGRFDKTFTKVNKNFEVSLFYMLGKSNINGEVNLILHLPGSQMAMKQIIIDKLQGNEFEYKVNGESFKVKFNKVGVLKEGWSSFYSLDKRNEGLIAIMDIGGRTTDVFTFNNGIQEQEKSIGIGMMNVFSDIADNLNAKGQNRKLEDIHKLLENNLININDFSSIIDKYSKAIVNDLKVDIENLQDYKIYITGGGAEYFIDNIKEIYTAEILKNALCSNCYGSHRIGVAKGLDK